MSARLDKVPTVFKVPRSNRANTGAAIEAQSTYVTLAPGDPAPRFGQRLSSGGSFILDRAAGHYNILCFFISGADPLGIGAYKAANAHRHLFDDRRASFFGISMDPGDESTGRLGEGIPGIRVFWDFDASVSRLYGAVAQNAEAPAGAVAARRFWLVLDPMLRVMTVVPFRPDGSDAAEVFAYVEALPPPERFTGSEHQAPVLMLPNVFEPDLCRRLVALYEEHGGAESGFMRERDGKTVLVIDPLHKRRKDYTVEDRSLIELTKQRIARRIVPEIARAYQFHVTRIERFIVACYAADDDGHFNAHRDNTTKGTAHRRFAVSLNLNDDYDGGEVNFPEYGPKSFKPAPGAAVVFSCSLLHAASKVTRGTRYAFLPFLYDEAAAAIREQNNSYLDPGIGEYRASELKGRQ